MRVLFSRRNLELDTHMYTYTKFFLDRMCLVYENETRPQKL